MTISGNERDATYGSYAYGPYSANGNTYSGFNIGNSENLGAPGEAINFAMTDPTTGAAVGVQQFQFSLGVTTPGEIYSITVNGVRLTQAQLQAAVVSTGGTSVNSSGNIIANVAGGGNAAYLLDATALGLSGGIENVTITTEHVEDRNPRDYAFLSVAIDPTPVCFAAGTHILGEYGEVLVEDLYVGSLVHTVDNGLQAVAWIGSSHWSRKDLEEHPDQHPIRIKAHALGPGRPQRDLVVSPQHRLLASSKICERVTGAPEICVAAKFLTAIDGIDAILPQEGVTYYHILLRNHELVLSESIPSETFVLGENDGICSSGREALGRYKGFDPSRAWRKCERNPQTCQAVCEPQNHRTASMAAPAQ